MQAVGAFAKGKQEESYVAPIGSNPMALDDRLGKQEECYVAPIGSNPVALDDRLYEM